MDWNIYSAIILLTLLVSLTLDLVANGLNLKCLRSEPPAELAFIFEAERYRRSQSYTRARTWFGWVAGALSLSLLLVFWVSGGFGWFDRWTRSFGWSEIPTGLLYVGGLVLGGSLLSLPLSLYSTFVIEERYGFNRTTLRTWVMDQLKGGLVAAFLGGPLLVAVLWFFTSFEKTGWLMAWAVFIGFSLFAQLVFPSVILPLFFRFTPLEEGELRQALIGYAEKVAFPLRDVFVIDGSRRSSKSNAFFTGIGRRKRIALFDTLVEKHEVPELVSVLAHEVGHYRRRHIPIGIALSALQVGAMLYLLQLFLTHQGLYDAFGVEQMSAHVGLVLFGLLASAMDQLLSVAANWLSRRFELQADRFAAQTTGNPEALIRALEGLARDNLTNLTPHPLLVFLEYSHPPLGERMAALRTARLAGE